MPALIKKQHGVMCLFLWPVLQYPQCHLCSPGMELEELFHEYEAGETQEARLVKDFDKVCP